MQDAISLVIDFVKSDIDGICNAHDFYHIERVRKLAKVIQESEKQGDPVVIEISALLHESFDDKFFTEEQLPSRKVVITQLLQSLHLSVAQIDTILFVIDNVGFGKSTERKHTISLPIEFHIVEDADRLEKIGAIAIARTFAYGGQRSIPIYNPNITPRGLITRSNYGSCESGINYFYETLLTVKDAMYTKKGKEIAEKRHAFTKRYLTQFLQERECEI